MAAMFWSIFQPYALDNYIIGFGINISNVDITIAKVVNFKKGLPNSNFNSVRPIYRHLGLSII